MIKRGKNNVTILVAIAAFAFLFATLCVSLWSENSPTGNVIGFIYAQDGTTPLDQIAMGSLS